MSRYKINYPAPCARSRGYHAPPSLIVEVIMKKPMEFSWDSIPLKGTLELPEKDPNGSFYILKDAEVVK